MNKGGREMYIYFVRWSVYNDDELFLTGQSEMQMNTPISSIDDIETICDLIRRSINGIHKDDTVLIDFYSLLKKKEVK